MKADIEVMKETMKKGGSRKTDTCPDKGKKKDNLTRIEWEHDAHQEPFTQPKPSPKSDQGQPAPPTKTPWSLE